MVHWFIRYLSPGHLSPNLAPHNTAVNAKYSKRLKIILVLQWSLHPISYRPLFQTAIPRILQSDSHLEKFFHPSHYRFFTKHPHAINSHTAEKQISTHLVFKQSLTFSIDTIRLIWPSSYLILNGPYRVRKNTLSNGNNSWTRLPRHLPMEKQPFKLYGIHPKTFGWVYSLDSKF